MCYYRAYMSSSRWDTHQHRLADVPVPGNEHIMVPGQDYSNPRVKDFANGNTAS